VDRDAISARAFGEDGKGHGIWFHGAAHRGGRLPVTGLANGSAMIDVNAEEQHGSGRFDPTKRVVILERKTK
jgi:hypothetical protein